MKKIYTFLFVAVLLTGMMLRNDYSKNDIKTYHINTINLNSQLTNFIESKYNLHFSLSNCFNFILKKSAEKHSGVILIKSVTTEATNTLHKISIQGLFELSFNLLIKSAERIPQFGHQIPPIKPPSLS